MQTLQELENRFHEGIDRVVKELINDYGLRHEEEVRNLSDPLLRWQDFVIRYIANRPRKIFASNKFPKKLEIDIEKSLHHLETLVQRGSDLNPYQSKGLMLYNDASANKRQQRTDFLWADWGIHHLHLTIAPLVSGKYFSERSKWLLFCVVGTDFFCLIDIKSHDEPELFSNPDLLMTMANSWPKIMEQYRINGLLSANKAYSAIEISALRKGGVSSFVTIGNEVFIGPGMGVTTASTSTRVSMVTNNIRRYIAELAKIVHDSTNQFKVESFKSGVTNPEYSICLTPRGLAVYEEHEKKAFVLPRGSVVGRRSFLTELHDQIAPEWAIDFAMKKHPFKS